MKSLSKAAASHAEWEKAPGFYEILTNEHGKQSWPITGATFVLMHKTQDKPESGKGSHPLFDWAYDKEQTRQLWRWITSRCRIMSSS